MSGDGVSARDGPSLGETCAAISFRGVGLSLGGERIHDDLSFDVASGELVCLLGPSGCGKSTALRLIGDLVPPDRGDVRVEGVTPAEAWERIAYVFQSPRLLPWRTALDNAAFGIEMRSPAMPREDRRGRARQELERVGLGADQQKMPVVLSGGERQRVAIARALAVDPHIMLMDEPFSALDPSTRADLRMEIVRLWRETGKTIVFVTHDIDEALVLADRIVILTPKPARVARIIAIGAPRPREIDATAELRDLRRELADLFRELARKSVGTPQ